MDAKQKFIGFLNGLETPENARLMKTISEGLYNIYVNNPDMSGQDAITSAVEEKKKKKVEDDDDMGADCSVGLI